MCPNVPYIYYMRHNFTKKMLFTCLKCIWKLYICMCQSGSPTLSDDKPRPWDCAKLKGKWVPTSLPIHILPQTERQADVTSSIYICINTSVNIIINTNIFKTRFWGQSDLEVWKCPATMYFTMERGMPSLPINVIGPHRDLLIGIITIILPKET